MAELSAGQIRSIFLWGAVGGVLPTLGKIAGTYGANFDAPPPNVLGVAIALTLYAAIGSIVSRAIANPDMKQSLFAGIAAPAIVVSVLAGASDSRSLRTGQQTSGFSLFTPALAAPADRRGEPPMRAITMETKIIGSYPLTGGIAVNVDNGRRPLQVFYVDVSTIQRSESDTFTIPAGETRMRFRSLNGVTAYIDVAREQAITMEVKPKTSVKGDLLWALGSVRQLEIGEIVVTPVPE